MYRNDIARVAGHDQYRRFKGLVRTPNWLLKTLTQPNGNYRISLCYEDTDAYAEVTELVGLMVNGAEPESCQLVPDQFGCTIKLNIPYEKFFDIFTDVMSYWEAWEKVHEDPSGKGWR